jgi:isopenicillin N synthase-like dioxygenase
VEHGVAEEEQRAALAQMRAFFALPADAKRAIERTATNPWGYFDRELTKNRRDWKEIWDFGPACERGPLAGARPQFPAALPAFRAAVERWFATCHALSLRVLDALARALGAPPAELRAAFAPEHTSFLRLNHYPPCPAPAPHDLALDAEGALGIRHHTDSGALTVLLHDEHPGLQLRRGEQWALVRPLAGAFVVNLGDIAQVWSNDRWPAPLHRVIAHADRERFSAPYFLNPHGEAVYAPLASQCGPARPPRYRPIAWAEFRARRAAGDYADVGEEVQIGAWRT